MLHQNPCSASSRIQSTCTEAIGAEGGTGQQTESTGMPPTRSQFDPVELKSCAPLVSSPLLSVCTLVGQAHVGSEHLGGASTFVGRRECALFVDPFRQDWCDFEELDRLKGISMLTHSQAMLAARPVRQDSCQESLKLSTLRIFQVDAKAPGAHPELANAEPELQKAVFGSDPGRVRLTPALAINIFNQGKTRTKHSAALLSAEFGVSPKAIRDIWTKRSWASETRPHWTLEDELSFDSPWKPCSVMQVTPLQQTGR